jgi:uncharacterized membrane protein
MCPNAGKPSASSSSPSAFHNRGEVTVFVPSAPDATVGLVHVVDRERVRPVDATVFGVLGCMSREASACATRWSGWPG